MDINIIFSSIVAFAGDPAESPIDKVVSEMMPTPLVMITTFLSLMDLVIILTKFAYKPIKKSIDARKEYLKNHIEQTEENTKISDSKIDEADVLLNEAKIKSTKILEDAAAAGTSRSIEILSKAKRTTDDLMNETRKEIELEKQVAKDSIKNEMIDVAFEAAQKLLDKELDEKTNKRIIEEFIDSI